MSASDLRGSLQDAMNQLDPKRQNTRLSSMVLVGHSIGGLLVKFQVTHSDDKLWEAMPSESIDLLENDPEARRTIRDAFYFEPQPMIRKVIYVGVPHGANAQSDDRSERLGHRLTELPSSIKRSYRRLVKDANPPIFESETGIQIDDDPFATDSTISEATNELRMGTGVTVHSIIGNSDLTADGRLGDGLVAVDSAKTKGSQSDWYVSARHADLHRAEDTIREVHRILSQHLSSSGQIAAPTSEAQLPPSESL